MYRQIDVSKREQTSIARGLAVASADAPLGIYTDNSAIRTTQGFFSPYEKSLNYYTSLENYSLKNVLLTVSIIGLQKKRAYLFLNKLRNKANYGNVMRCANPWACPVCSAIISEGRKDEVKTAMDWWKAQGGDVLLLTLTAPHYSVLTLNP